MASTTKKMGPLEAYATGLANVVMWLAPTVVSAIVTTLAVRAFLEPSSTVIIERQQR